MPRLTERSPLVAGRRYSWWVEVALAPARVVRSGGPFAAEQHSGAITAREGECVQDAIESVMQTLARQMGRHRDQITMLQFDLRD